MEQTTQVPSDYLKIMQWNCNSILCRLPELKLLLSKMEKEPDVICLQETYLKNGTQLLLPNYNIERRDREDERKGGMAILIKKNISYTLLQPTDGLEEISISITLQHQKIKIINIYNHPAHKIDLQIYRKLVKNHNMILLGDFNAHSTLFG